MTQLMKLAWAAGFLDGEGCFRHFSGANINAPQVEKQPIIWLHNLFGGKIRKVISKPPRQNIWYWDLYGAHAVSVMLTLYPMLSPKRQIAIREVIRKWKLQPGRQRHSAIRPRNDDGTFV